MSILFACLKRNNFNETPCSKEVTEFKKCWTENAIKHRQNKLREKEGELSPGENKLSHRQISALLQKFP
ncbi:hypothetical protein O3M35_005617 [Rhynocoris fuscipes]|uniref:CHCH domain-containing protein n=1 Tax=Rhynocoris fuscipes TaxID=488301 RepID=A0AAW1DJD4_9HEMI